MAPTDTRPIVLITGATGNLGRSLGKALGHDYRIVGLDLKAQGTEFQVFEADFTSGPSVALALRHLREAFGARIASVIHLVAFFDFSGEDNPLYQSVNVDGTRHLIQALQDFEVEQFVYASTMLVHAPCRPGERIDEQQPIDARWAYPESKAAAEAARTKPVRRLRSPLRTTELFARRREDPPRARSSSRRSSRTRSRRRPQIGAMRRDARAETGRWRQDRAGSPRQVEP